MKINRSKILAKDASIIVSILFEPLAEVLQAHFVWDVSLLKCLAEPELQLVLVLRQIQVQDERLQCLLIELPNS